MKKYKDFIRIGIKEQLAYPMVILAKLLAKIIYLYLQISLWNALFSSGGQTNALLNRGETVHYIIIATMISSFMECDIISWINEQIRTGNIVFDIMRPMDYKKMAFSRHLGETIVKIVFLCIPLCILVFSKTSEPLLCRKQIAIGFLSLCLGYLIQFLYVLIIGMLAFWLIVTWPLNMLLSAIYKLLSGVWIPLTLFPQFLYKLNLFLPFRAIYAIPATILTSPMNIHKIRADIFTQLLWLFLLFVLMQCVWKTGKRKLIVQGG